MNDDDDAKPGRCTGSGCSGATLNRRAFLSISGTSAGLLAVAAAVPGCGNPTGSDPTGPVAAGNLSALAAGTLLVMGNVIVARDVNGVYAMTAVCTHQGCLVGDANKTIAGGLQCPCHGSAFDGGGAVTHGPAQRALQHYAVTIAADGGMTVEGAQPVEAGARTVVA